MIFFLREAFSSAITSVTGILPTLADKADYSKVRTTEGATMKDENRGTVSQSASTGSTAKSEAVYTKNLEESMRFFFGGINYRIRLQLDRAPNWFVCLVELKPMFF